MQLLLLLMMMMMMHCANVECRSTSSDVHAKDSGDWSTTLNCCHGDDYTSSSSRCLPACLSVILLSLYV